MSKESDELPLVEDQPVPGEQQPSQSTKNIGKSKESKDNQTIEDVTELYNEEDDNYIFKDENDEEIEIEFDDKTEEKEISGLENNDEEEYNTQENLFDKELNAEQIYNEIDEEKKNQLMLEYTKIVMSIDSQNRIIEEIKNKISEKSQKCPRTKCDERELHDLRCCLEKENLRLQCLTKKAIKMQKCDPLQPWHTIQIATTIEEDDMPYNPSNIISQKCGKFMYQQQKQKNVYIKDGNQKPCVTSNNDKELQKFLNCLLRQVNKLKEQKCSNTYEKKFSKKSSRYDESSKFNRGRNKKNTWKVGKELHRSFNMQEKLVANNSCLEKRRFKMQEELLHRDRVIDCLQQKIQLLQSEICKRRKGKLKQMKENLMTHSIMPELTNVNNQSVNLQKGVIKLQSSIERLKADMHCLRRERDYWDNQVSDHHKSPDEYNFNSPISKSEKIKNLKESFQELLNSYAKKDSELRYLKEKMNNYIQGEEIQPKKEYNEDIENVEIKILEEKLNDLNEEKEEFKYLLKEQAQQLEEIRCKYLVTQQKVEEQKCILEKTSMTNKRIEEQIASEIKRITQKFKQKCEELMKFPKLLEQEQIKLANCVQEKEEMKQKLNIVCKEYTTLKRQYDNNADGPENIDWMTKAIRTEKEIFMMREKCNNLKRDKELICDSLVKAKDDYECLTNESARIIARTKDRAEQQKNLLSEHTNKLEKELAQCRATSFLNISDREELIKELQGQINTLCCSFDTAKEQISCLQTQISYFSSAKVV